MTIKEGDLVRVDVCRGCPEEDDISGPRPCDTSEGCAFKSRRGKLAVVHWADEALNVLGYPHRVTCKMLVDDWDTGDLMIDDVIEIKNPLVALAEASE